MSDIADDLRAVYEGASGDNIVEKDETGPLVREVEPKPIVEDKPIVKDDGRFAPTTPAENKVPEDKESKTAPVEEGSEAGTPATPPAPAQPATRAPVSWKPEIREEWAKLPPTVQAEVTRREAEIQTAMRQSAQTRQFYQQFEQTMAPYESILRSENAHPLVAIGELFKTAAALRTAPAPQRAVLVADMIERFGIDINLLDEALSARQNGQRPQPQQFDTSAIDAKLAPVLDFITQLKGQPEQQFRQEAAQTWAQFSADPANEFAEDVREEMADLLELAAKRNQPLSLSDAYKRATLAHPTIAGLVQQRQQSSSAAQQTAAARRAKEAAASIPSGGAPSRADEADADGSLGSDLRSSIKKLSNSR